VTANSRIPGFYKQAVADRLRVLLEQGAISQADHDALLAGQNVLQTEDADRLIENVIGVLGIPLALGLNFVVNGRDYLVPMAVEEPSIVAAVSSAAKTVRAGGGFTCRSSDPLLIGQVQVVGIENAEAARQLLLEARREILDQANSLHPNMVARGGGARDVEVRIHPATNGGPEMVVVHLVVDTRDAMGANLVNSMCEGVAPLIERLTGGKVFLRILSNLADRAMVKAEVVIPIEALAEDQRGGEAVRDGIILANHFAAVDPYRAATHNKGIMNGIDAVALATGNDWRAIEASAHAYASRQGYHALTRWWKTDEGHLAGALELPLKVGTVGGQIQSNPSVAIAHRVLGIKSARELAEVMCAVGLAQNFAAIRALSTTGIQRGHMALHARSVAAAAEAPPEIFEAVVDRLIEDGEIKVWRAKEIVAELLAREALHQAARTGAPAGPEGVGYGKLILFGEHAVVYGRHALAAPVALAMRATAAEADSGMQLLIPQWNMSEFYAYDAEPRHSLQRTLRLILGRLGLEGRGVSIRVEAGVPRAMGLGGSAALAVAVIRALNLRFELGLDDVAVNALAYEAEQIAHGRASGLDNAVATYGRPILFRRGEPPAVRDVLVAEDTELVVGLTGREGLTAKMVARVAAAREASWSAYERIFDEIDTLTLHGCDALERADFAELGRLMNLCHGLLNAIGVSTHDLERLVEVARDHGALGAKLTGAGGGGAMVALAPGNADAIERAMRAAGYRAFRVTLPRVEHPEESA
jgi:hydroxymethylglutaryl-CoA reductase